MSIFRVQKSSNYSVINNTFIFDERLSWKAKGILAYFLARPDDWQFYLKELVKHTKDGVDSTGSGVKELQDCGYINKERKRNDKGHLKEYEYTVYEIPQREKPKQDNPEQDNPILDNPTLLSTELKQDTDVKQNTDLNIYVENFEMLWKLYPNKKGKNKVSKKSKQYLLNIGYEKVKLAVERYINECKVLKREEQYILHGSTFFNGSFEDYISEDYKEMKNTEDESYNIFTQIAKDEGYL